MEAEGRRVRGFLATGSSERGDIGGEGRPGGGTLSRAAWFPLSLPSLFVDSLLPLGRNKRPKALGARRVGCFYSPIGVAEIGAGFHMIRVRTVESNKRQLRSSSRPRWNISKCYKLIKIFSNSSRCVRNISVQPVRMLDMDSEVIQLNSRAKTCDN